MSIRTKIAFVVMGFRSVILCTEQKGVSFIETSALDSTNVETAFTTLLTGNCVQLHCFGTERHLTCKNIALSMYEVFGNLLANTGESRQTLEKGN